MTDTLLNNACNILNVRPVRSLTAGGQKQVHVVSDVSNIESVLKLIDLGATHDPAALERARREVALLQSIDHPNVVSVKSDLYTFDTPPQAAFWLEELLDGTDLRTITVHYDFIELLNLGADTAAGLGAIHKAKVIHRDLSPGNVQRLRSGKYVIMDPGFAKHTLRSGLTIGGQPGTRGYLSPEHLYQHSGSPTAASDVFACCALVYYAATGESPIPFRGDDIEYYNRLKNATHSPLHSKRPDLPKEFCNVVERGLHKQPARRYRNGIALHDAFKEFQ